LKERSSRDNVHSIIKALFIAAALPLATVWNLAAAEAAKTYQVTGPVVEITAKAIVVEKGDERWEIARDEKTRTKGEPKVGDKVTVHYRMTATSVESKGESTEDKPSGKKKAK
jgi:hypothetical protein